MAFKIDFDFQQGMRSLGRMSRRAYEKVKEKTEEESNESEADSGSGGKTERSKDKKGED